ncbi:MAG: hypothetical protein AB8U44_03835, partial [Aaplasma endosymbiont of Hyalomma asiaticum]
FPDTKTSILFMLLDARFLLRAAGGVYEALLVSRMVKTSSIHIKERSFLPELRRIMRIEKRILDALDYVRDFSISDNIGRHTGLMELYETLNDLNKGFNNTIEENICGMDSLSNRLKLTCTCCTELLREMRKNKGRNSNARTVVLSDDLHHNLSCASNLGISIQNHKQVICDVYRMVVQGSADVLTSMPSPLAAGDGEKSYSIMQHVFQAVVLCSSVVSYNAEKLVAALLSETSRRTLSNTELGSLWALQSMLGVLCRSDGGGDASECSLRHARAFGTLSANLCISIALDDASRVFGENSKSQHMNYRILGLFVDLFCTVPLTLMSNSLMEIKKIFNGHNEELPHEVENVLFMLTDLKYFSYASNYAEEEEIYSAGEYNVRPCYYNADKKAASGLMEALVKLLAYSFIHNKKNSGKIDKRSLGNSHLVDWIDVLKVLLYEHIHLASVSSMLSHGINVLQDKKLQFFDAEFTCRDISKIIMEGKPDTTGNLYDNTAEIRDKISKSVKGIRSMLSPNVKKLCSEDSTKRMDAIQALHSRVWDNNKSKSLHCDELDKQLANYVLFRSYASASLALDIVDSCIWKSHEKPSLDIILIRYFSCAETKSPGAACNYGVRGAESEKTASKPVVYLGNPASFVAEEVSNSLDAVEVGIVHDLHSLHPTSRSVLEHPPL